MCTAVVMSNLVRVTTEVADAIFDLLRREPLDRVSLGVAPDTRARRDGGAVVLGAPLTVLPAGDGTTAPAMLLEIFLVAVSAGPGGLVYKSQVSSRVLFDDLSLDAGWKVKKRAYAS